MTCYTKGTNLGTATGNIPKGQLKQVNAPEIDAAEIAAKYGANVAPGCKPKKVVPKKPK